MWLPGIFSSPSPFSPFSPSLPLYWTGSYRYPINLGKRCTGICNPLISHHYKVVVCNNPYLIPALFFSPLCK